MACQHEEFDCYFSECIRRKYGLPCCVACHTCHALEFESDPQSC